MVGTSLGFFVEALVAILLAVTIAYCVIVNRKLEQLRSDQSELRDVVRELSMATEQAENAIASLHSVVGTAEETLSAHIDRAAELELQLQAAMETGDELVQKLKVAASLPKRPGIARPANGDEAARAALKASQIGLGLLNAQRRADAQGGEAAS